MGPEPAKEENRKGGQRALLWRPKGATHWVAEQRLRFLRTAMTLPKAKEKLDSLLDSETLRLAQRKFARNYAQNSEAERRASEELVNRIETWAIETGLARKPVQNYWIFDTGMNILRELVHGPESSDLDEEVIPTEWSVEWSATVDLSAQVKDIPDFTCGEWDPCAESEFEYRKTVNNALEEYLKDVRVKYDHAGFEPGVTRRDDKHFEWLVRHDMLGESYEDIANISGHATIEAHVQTTTSQLRSDLALPRLSRGRPKTLAHKT